MSQSETSTPFRRDNFFGGSDDDEPQVPPANYGVGDGPQNNPGPAGTWHEDPNKPPEIIAHKLLVEEATILCKTTLLESPDRGWQPHMDAEGIDAAPGHDPWAMHRENTERELSDPKIRPPSETVRDQRHRKRVEEFAGYISNAETTACWIQDRPEEEFLQIVREWLGACHGDLREWKRKQVMDFSRRLKCSGDLRDVHALERIVAMVRNSDYDYNKR